MPVHYPVLPTTDERVIMKYQQLTEGQRYQISVLREDNSSCSEIGKRVGVSKSTVSREVRRNGTAGGYSAAEAQCH